MSEQSSLGMQRTALITLLRWFGKDIRTGPCRVNIKLPRGKKMGWGEKGIRVPGRVLSLSLNTELFRGQKL